MICPHCNTDNPAENIYCMNCGRLLSAQATEAGGNNLSPRRALFFAAGQTLIIVILLYIFRSILLGLAFIKELQIASWQITASEIVSIVMYLLILVALLIFARSLVYLWPQSFPRYANLAVVLTAILYIIGLSLVYSMVKPLFLRFISEPEPLLYTRIFLAVAAICLAGWALFVAYQSLPSWMESVRVNLAFPTYQPPNKPE